MRRTAAQRVTTENIWPHLREKQHRPGDASPVEYRVTCTTGCWARGCRLGRGGESNGRRKFVYYDSPMLRFLTAGESHGQALTVIVEGAPAGLPLDADTIAHELWRRQLGYGRGRRMAIESDRAEILSGVRAGHTLGSPIALLIRNRDWPNWQWTMAVESTPPEGATGAHRAPVTRPRPGHADLAGVVKYERSDIRDVLERASARETAARVAAGAVARQLLKHFDIGVASHVLAVGSVSLPEDRVVSYAEATALAPDAPLHCADPEVEAAMIAAIERAKEDGDTLGGSFEVIAHQVPAGLGSYVHWDRRLDGRLAQAIMSIPAIKAVGIGLGHRAARLPGSRVHDPITPPEASSPHAEWPMPASRPTNNAGGLEGGITNGEDLRVVGHMKPISTLMRPLPSIDLRTGDTADAAIERSDVCAVSAAAVVGEAMVAFVLAQALLERYGEDSVPAIARAVQADRARLLARGHQPASR